MRISHRLTWPGAWGFYLGGGGECFYFSAFLKRHTRKNKNQTKHPSPQQQQQQQKTIPVAFSGLPIRISTFYQLSYFLPLCPIYYFFSRVHHYFTYHAFYLYSVYI